MKLQLQDEEMPNDIVQIEKEKFRSKYLRRLSLEDKKTRTIWPDLSLAKRREKMILVDEKRASERERKTNTPKHRIREKKEMREEYTWSEFFLSFSLHVFVGHGEKNEENTMTIMKIYSVDFLFFFSFSSWCVFLLYRSGSRKRRRRRRKRK